MAAILFIHTPEQTKFLEADLTNLPIILDIIDNIACLNGINK